MILHDERKKFLFYFFKVISQKLKGVFCTVGGTLVRNILNSKNGAKIA
jgi:hypothetical protein